MTVPDPAGGEVSVERSRRGRATALALGVAIGVGAAMIGFSEYAFRDANGHLRRLGVIAKSRLELLQMAGRIADARLGQQTYLLTGRDDHLVPFNESRADAIGTLESLGRTFESLNAVEAQQQRGRLTESVERIFREMDEVLRLQRQGRKDAALWLLADGVDQKYAQAIRRDIDALVGVQNREMGRSFSELGDTLGLHRIGIASLTALGLLVLAMFLRQGASLARSRDQQQAQLAAERARLESEVRRRTAQLTDLAQHLSHSREEERSRLARDLHDELGALLTAAKLDVARLRPALAQIAPELVPRMAHLVTTLDSGIALKRRIIEDLRPSLLENLGLLPALEVLCAETADRLGVPIDASLAPVSLTPRAEMTVYRAVQEALSNVERHARSPSVEVRLGPDERRAGRVRLVVRDRGVGMPAHAGTVVGATHGLAGVRLRVEADGGELRVVSGAGEGTSVEIDLPALAATPATPAPPR